MKYWNDSVMEVVKEKKKVWKRYLEIHTPENRQVYDKARNLAKEVIKAGKMESLEAPGRDIEENYRANQSRFWRTVKGLRKVIVSRARSIKNEEGNMITDIEQILCRVITMKSLRSRTRTLIQGIRKKNQREK